MTLEEHLAENPERKKRFEREAKAISQLNHPRILLSVRAGTLLAQPFDPARAELTGDAVALAQDVVSDPNTRRALFS